MNDKFLFKFHFQTEKTKMNKKQAKTFGEVKALAEQVEWERKNERKKIN